MALHFYNTMTRRLEPFQPRETGRAALYTCGPTVYNYAHIGNFRAYVFEDVLRRVLQFCGYQVVQVMNLTDVDDKTIRDSQAAGLPLDQFTARFKQAFFEDLKTLRIQPAEHYPAATDHIAGMIALVEQLLAKGFAYVGDDGSVYFSIDKFPEYGRLAHIDLSGQRSGVRINTDEYAKESVADFALWKAWAPSDGPVAWDSPWGRGRPGWHIECSAMSMHFLGPHFDIHTGGVDNMFPHHEDEIAQSVCATGHGFVNYWLHNEHLLVDGQKMAKSAGNFFTIRDLLAKGYTGREIRWLLISAHYRQKLNFTFDGLAAGRTVLRRFDDFTRRLKDAAREADRGQDAARQLADQALAAFAAGVEDDLNTPVAIAALFDFMRDANKALDAGQLSGSAVALLLDAVRRMDSVLAVLDLDQEAQVPAEILAKAAERQAARKARDFARADALRDELKSLGWVIEDTPKGPRVVPAP
jgi:cysteinyl-tRNA synthetase